MGYRSQGSQGPQQGGYGQPELRPGVPVTSADGQWKGTVVEVLPAGRGYEGTVRVQWEGYGLTYVTLGMLGYDNGRFVVRADGGQAQAAQGDQQAQNASSTNAASANDAAAVNNRLAAPRGASEGDDLTVLPSTSRPQQPDVNTGYGQPARGGEDATRLAAPTSNEASGYAPRPVERVEADDMTRLPQSGMQTPHPAYPTPQQPNPANTPYYTPRPSEQVEADDSTRLPQSGMQGSPAPVSRPAYPAPQQPAQPVQAPNPYYPEAPPLPESVQRRPAAEPAYVVEPDQEELVVPTIEERLTARPEWRDAGNITVRTHTEEVPQSFTQQVEREEAFVERVPMGRVLAEGETVEPRQEGNTFIMPVIVEEAVVVTRRVLLEEVRVTKRSVQNAQTVETMVRRQRAEVDTGSLGDRVHDDRTSS